MIVYQGPSELDQQPIVAILTGIDRPSHNPKTGPMAQLWILREDLSPLDAVASRADYSICGDCPLRGDSGLLKDRACYVLVKNAPLQVWRAYKRGKYQAVDPGLANQLLRAKGRSVRLGAYGDPVALPVAVLSQLCTGVKHTGYTHHWQYHPMYRHWLMASIETVGGREQARVAGWRTFRTLAGDEQAIGGEEIDCPASAESGHRTTCERCGLCAGGRRPARDITIRVHGAGKGRFIQVRTSA